MNTSKETCLKKSSGGSVREGGQWECPVCLLVPPKEIYICSSGHSICGMCASKVKNCPTCRVGIGGNQPRNFDLEHVLDSMKFECSWNGCDDVMDRSDFAKHEDTCSHNPNAVKLCNFMGQLSCNFKFSLESLEDAGSIEQVLDHLKTHGYRETKLKLGHQMKMAIFIDSFRSKHATTKYLLGNHFAPKVLVMDYGDKKYVFLQLARIYLDGAGQGMLTFPFLQLTPNSGQSPFTFSMLIKRAPKSNTILTWGPASMGTISWAIKPMNVNQFMESCARPEDEQSSFPLPMPVSHLENFYVNSNRHIEFAFSIISNK